MKVVHVNKDSFKSVVLDSKVPVLVDFWAPWCGPCRMIAPVLEELAAEVGDKALVAKVNVDEEMELGVQFGVMAIPTLMIFQDGSLQNRITGFRDKEVLKTALGL